MIRLLARLRTWRRNRRFEAFKAHQLRRELDLELARLPRLTRHQEAA